MQSRESAAPPTPGTEDGMDPEHDGVAPVERVADAASARQCGKSAGLPGNALRAGSLPATAIAIPISDFALGHAGRPPGGSMSDQPEHSGAPPERGDAGATDDASFFSPPIRLTGKTIAEAEREAISAWLIEGFPHSPLALQIAMLIKDGAYLRRAASERKAGEAGQCGGCGGPHRFDTSVPSVLWNRVVRAAGLADYLCATCVVRAFAKAGVSFTATLYGDDFDGLPISVEINGATSTAAHEIQEQNNSLRAALYKLSAWEGHTVESVRAYAAAVLDAVTKAL